MKRLFIACKIPSDPVLLSFFRSVKNLLSEEKIKWVEENNMHITFKFLGETDERKIPFICKVVEKCAGTKTVIDYKLFGMGVFGSKHSPRVIFTRIEPFTGFATVMEQLQEELEQIGFPGDRQNHVPHLTLGRIKYIRDKEVFQRVVDQFSGFSSPGKKFESLILYESILKPAGPVYIALDTFTLRKEKSPDNHLPGDQFH